MGFALLSHGEKRKNEEMMFMLLVEKNVSVGFSGRMRRHCWGE